MKTFRYKRGYMIIALGIIFIAAALLFIYYQYRNYGVKDCVGGDIPYSMVQNVHSIIKPIANRTMEMIAYKTLENTGYSRWQEHWGSLDILAENVDIIAGGGDEFLVSLSLPPQGAVIACYKRDDGVFEYIGKIPGLLPVTGMSMLENYRLDNGLLIAEQVQNEMLGAFFNAHYSDVFLWQGGHFVRVLDLLTDYNAYWNESWDGKDEDAHWLWLKQSSQVEYADKGETINVNYVQRLLQSTSTDIEKLPRHADFITRYFRTVGEKYRWNSDWNLYILGEGIDSLTGERIALLKDYRNSISSFVRGTDFNMVKVINSNNSTYILPANRFK